MERTASRRARIALGAGLILGIGGAIAAGQFTGQAAANTHTTAASGVTLSATQLLINQRISQAAVRRSNESLELLDPIRPNPKRPTKVLGWTTNSLRDLAITTKKLNDRAVTTPKIADNAITPAQLNEGLREAKPRWARVAETGTPAQVSGVAAVARTAVGTYTVKFDRNVSTCAVLASIGAVGTTPPPARHTVSTWTAPTDPSVVNVRTVDQAGAEADTPFHITALC